MSSPVNFLSWVRIFLYPFALVYGAVIWLRNRLYDSGFFSSIRFSIPVITVGNLSVGGTGKTPHVEYLIRLLEYEYSVATMSRGYKRRTQGFLLAGEKTNAIHIGDEPMQYHLKYPTVAVSVAEDRMMGIPKLLYHRPDVDVVLLDDAYQHRSVKAGLNILITDYSRPYYTDYILPFGRLRESRSAAHRADVIIVSKCPPSLDGTTAADMAQNINPLPNQQVFFTAIRYGISYDFFSREKRSLDGVHALLVCGIARPEPLIVELERQCAGVHVLPYADHHYFLKRDLEEIKFTYDGWQKAPKAIVTTEKDATRLHLYRDVLESWGITIIVMPVEVIFLLGGKGAFESTVRAYIEKERSDNDISEDSTDATVLDLGI